MRCSFTVQRGGEDPPSRHRRGTWNVGGLTAQQVLELTHSFSGDPTMEALQVLLLQEIITDAGVFFIEGQGWVVVYGKNKGDWRGTAIAYKNYATKHTDTRLMPGGIRYHADRARERQAHEIYRGTHTAPCHH